jgi:3-isopropylmalate dehydratase
MAAAAALRGKLTDIRQFNHKATQSTVDLNLDNKSLPPVVEDTLFPPPAPQVALNKAAPKTTTSSGASDKVFRTLKGIAAPMYMENVDTDMIIPKQFLKTLTRTGLAKGLFYNLRVDANTKAALDFVLDRPPFNDAKILISTGKNFGCGSSREHAAWSL